jgi:hypothetical protein
MRQLILSKRALLRVRALWAFRPTMSHRFHNERAPGHVSPGKSDCEGVVVNLCRVKISTGSRYLGVTFWMCYDILQCVFALGFS